MENITETLEKIKQTLLNKYDLQAIILFGSYARNSATPESDLDIAIKAEKSLPKIELFNLKNELEDIAKIDVDLIDLDAELSDGFRYEILINGETLYCKNSYEFDLYKLDMFREYLELNESRQEILERVMEGESPYGK